MSTKILFGFVLGMMMAIDNGGPINKTAYVFGIGMLISYDYYPMAAVMAGGMIPPLSLIHIFLQIIDGKTVLLIQQ